MTPTPLAGAAVTPLAAGPHACGDGKRGRGSGPTQPRPGGREKEIACLPPLKGSYLYPSASV